MNRQSHAPSREAIVANAMHPVVRELRLVDIADYIAFIRLEHFASLSDIVDSSAELYFMPGTLRLGHGGEADVGWQGNPRVVLDLELCPEGARVYFQLTMTALDASIEINYVAFDKPHDDPQADTDFLASALDRARFQPLSLS